jgi:hypothetical protein
MLVHTLNLTVSEGKTFITLKDWVATLPADRQAAFAVALGKQQVIDAANTAAGYLVGHENGVVKWSDNAPQSAINQHDADWKTFFEEYLAATGTTLNVVETKA